MDSFSELHEGHAAKGLTCERDPEMATFLSARALEWQRQGLCRVYVLGTSGGELRGFYTLSMAAAQTGELPEGAPRPPIAKVPVCLIGHVARDDDAPRGTGRRLLADAIRRTVAAARNIGCCGVFLHAKNTSLVTYYEQFGFVPMARSKFPRAMFLALGSATAAMDA